MVRQTLYNAFTKINPLEKNAVINFLHEHTPNTSKSDIRHAIEYALKEIPSFGGFIYTAHQDKQLVGVIIATKTGMTGYNAKHLFVFVSLLPLLNISEDSATSLLSRAIDYADGDIALHIKPNNPALKLYQKLGFQAQFVELRLSKEQVEAKISA